MPIEENGFKITRSRENYPLNMNLGEVIECIRDIRFELDENQCGCPDCSSWITSALLSVEMSLRLHSMEEGVLPSEYQVFEGDNFKEKRSRHRTLEHEVSNLWAVINQMPCRKGSCCSAEKTAI